MNLVKTKIKVCKIGQISIRPSSKKNPCGICGRKIMAIAVLCKSCGNWIHGRCAMNEMVINTPTIDRRCRKWNGCHVNGGDQEEKLHEDVETVTDLSHLGDGMYTGGGCETAVTSTSKLFLAKFRDCHDLLCGKKLF